MLLDAWVPLHDGPRAETELLADLLQAIDVKTRIVAPERRRKQQPIESRLEVERGAFEDAQSWLDEAFREADRLSKSGRRFSLGA